MVPPTATLVQAGPAQDLIRAMQFTVGREHEHMAERGVRHEQASGMVHGQAVRATGAEGRAEAADLGNAAVLHERQSPHGIVACHRDEQGRFRAIEHQAVRADAGMDQAVKPTVGRQPIDASGRIVETGLALIGEIDVTVAGDVQIVAAA